MKISVQTKRQVSEWEYDIIGVDMPYPEDAKVNIAEEIETLRSYCLRETVKQPAKSTKSVKDQVKAVQEMLKGPDLKPVEKSEPVKEAEKVEESTKEEEIPVVPEQEKEEEEAPKKKAAPAKKKLVKKEVFVRYDRENDVHKKHVGTHYDVTLSSWRKDPMVKAAVVYASKTIATEEIDFMDGNGVLLAPFFDRMDALVEEKLKESGLTPKWEQNKK